MAAKRAAPESMLPDLEDEWFVTPACRFGPSNIAPVVLTNADGAGERAPARCELDELCCNAPWRRLLTSFLRGQASALGSGSLCMALSDAVHRAKSLADYERQKRWAPETQPVEVITFAKIQQKQSAYNPVTSRYRDRTAEATQRQRELDSRAASEARSHATLHAKRRGYNILSNLNAQEQAEIPFAEATVVPRAGPPSYVAPPAFRSRTTTNHTHYSYDIISNEPLPEGHDSLAPTIRSGSEEPVDVVEGMRVAKRRIELESETRAFDIVSGRTRDVAPVAATSSPASGAGSAASPDRGYGKKQFVRKADYNIINGEQLTPSGVARTSATRWV